MDHKLDVKECLSRAEFNKIMTGLREEFESESHTDEEKLNRLEEVILLYLHGEHFTEASGLIKELHEAAPHFRIQFLEFDLLVRKEDGDDDGKNDILNELYDVRDELTWYPWTSEIAGCCLFDKHKYEEALIVFNNALNKALKEEGVRDENYISRLTEYIEDVKKKQKPAKEEEEEAGKGVLLDVEDCLSKAEFSKILTGLSDEFNSESTPDEDKLDRLFEVIQLYSDRKLFTEASKLIKELHGAAPHLRIHFLEFELLLRKGDNDHDGQNRILKQLLDVKDDQMVWYSWTSQIIENHLVGEKKYEEALLVCNRALSKELEVCETDDNKDYIDDLRIQIEKLKSKVQLQKNKAKDPEVLAAEFAEDDRKKENQEKLKKEKRKGKLNKWSKTGNKKGEKKAGKNENKEEEKKGMKRDVKEQETESTSEDKKDSKELKGTVILERKRDVDEEKTESTSDNRKDPEKLKALCCQNPDSIL